MKIKQISTLVLSLFFTIVLSSCDSSTDSNIAVTGINMDRTAATVIGVPHTLKATLTPENASNKNVTWTSSDESVAKVENGSVTGVKKGTATITATSADGGFAATCIVTTKERCKGITKENQQCKNAALDNGYCTAHQDQVQ